MRIARALTIAGSDSGGGAGIQADLKTFAALGVHGMSAVTALTAQNTVEVTMVHDVPVEMVREQIRVVVRDIGVDAVKTGMLHTSEIIEAVAEELRGMSAPLVVDPVMVAKSGASLLREDARRSLVEVLLPLATVVTPNAREAEVLSGLSVRDIESQKQAARRIAELGPKAVVVKGGHVAGDKVADVLYWEGEFKVYESERLESRNTHGTGCTFASAIAAELAKKTPIPKAVEIAKSFVMDAIRYGLPLGGGHGPVNPTGRIFLDADRFQVLRLLRQAVEILENLEGLSRLIPESQSNLVMALEAAESVEDVAAIPGRIVRLDDRVKASSCPWFGASRHVAKAVLTAMKFNPRIRSAMNLRYGRDILEAAESLGWRISYYDRRLEPEDVKRAEGRSVPWGVETAVKRLGVVPDLIYHEGDWGKEPMTLIFGETPLEVVEKVKALIKKLRGR